ncbi:GHKL domain-containing protein [Algibacter amylolyticus]|uniref:histidine kinase n=1 Tax=Algibacter amylolyticus TaxID=1608400 RepID=A0A5M7AV54_9FLAO|nr:ATP-binding protein [Algibacter amylolyticus]KAA5821406.1 GHKL domain-containing protein [Algibacter amylolyticus]MBB5268277.1 signal transduction histidine kinase [Algibacter amylolyticus]TSJ72918.1 GHKL domain-containing protein [Algibacter amylolyticus]
MQKDNLNTDSKSSEPTQNAINLDSKQLEKDKIIERHLRFQDLLISISTKYINSDLSDIDKLISESLQQIGEFVQSDRSYIFSYDFVNNTCSNTYEWCASDIEPEIDNLQNIPLDYITHWLESHKKGEAFYVEDVSLLEEDGEFGLRAILEPQGIKSLITIPKIKNNELIGFIGFDSVKKLNSYSENEQDILFVYANMLVNVIQKKEYEARIKAQEKKKEELLNSLSIQNEELNEYAHVVSHDLKAPLINIHTLVSWFMSDNKDVLDKTAFKPLEQVLFNVEKMDFLIKGILDYSTIDKLEQEDKLVDFNLIINEVLQTMLIPEHIKISIQEDLPSVFGNTWRFKQVFQNLIQNAVKYCDKDSGLVELGFVEKDENYEFFVKDNGMGINTDYFDKIFKVFTKLESTGSSSGIGLSIVKKIVSYYKGTIWVESKEGVGSTFYFTIFKND